MLHLWKVQTYMAPGVKTGITAFKGRQRAVWVYDPPAFMSLCGHHAHLGLGRGMNFIADNNAMLGMQSCDYNGM